MCFLNFDCFVSYTFPHKLYFSLRYSFICLSSHRSFYPSVIASSFCRWPLSPKSTVASLLQKLLSNLISSLSSEKNSTLKKCVAMSGNSYANLILWRNSYFYGKLTGNGPENEHIQRSCYVLQVVLLKIVLLLPVFRRIKLP